MREGNDKPFDVTLVREEISVQTVKSHEDGQVGYIRISQFNQETAVELKSAIEKIQADIGKDKVQGYILDLRNNPAGLIDQAIAVSNDFLDGGEIVEIRGRQPDHAQRFTATGGDLAAGKPIIVLVNGGSASDSEIVAGALQDHRRATIVGTRSFGKGTVQTIVPLGDKAALRLTTGRYYTPSGRSIQTDGIVPDIVISENVPPELAKAQAHKIGAVGSVPSTGGTPPETKGESGSSGYIPPDPKDDTQLNYALDLLRGAQVNAAFPPDHSKGVPN
jgi:carboxyl-terminal processing protease